MCNLFRDIVRPGSLAVPAAGLIAPAAQTVWLYASYVTLLLGYAFFFVNGAPILVPPSSGALAQPQSLWKAAD